MTHKFGELTSFSADPETNQFVLQRRKASRVFLSCLPSNPMNRVILYSLVVFVSQMVIVIEREKVIISTKAYFFIYKYRFGTIEGGLNAA